MTHAPLTADGRIYDITTSLHGTTTARVRPCRGPVSRLSRTTEGTRDTQGDKKQSPIADLTPPCRYSGQLPDQDMQVE